MDKVTTTLLSLFNAVTYWLVWNYWKNGGSK